MLPKSFPLRLDVVLEAQVDGDVRPNSRRLLFSDVGLGHLDDAERKERQSHPGPASENDLAIVGSPGFESRDGVFDVAADFVSRLQLEKFEISKEVTERLKDEKSFRYTHYFLDPLYIVF